MVVGGCGGGGCVVVVVAVFVQCSCSVSEWKCVYVRVSMRVCVYRYMCVCVCLFMWLGFAQRLMHDDELGEVKIGVVRMSSDWLLKTLRPSSDVIQCVWCHV